MVNPRLVHLKKRGEFLRVASARRKFVTPSLILQARPHDESDAEDTAPIRVGFTVSRRVGNAVVRNRVRRRLRAAAEEIMPGFADANSDFVIIGRRSALGQEYTGLTGHLKSALAKYEKENNKQKPIAE
ncbi:MAG: ribonuclease P protein component [Rhodospirillaceae bacterium]|mgnify:FL=1|jgi:ribonuclease P protein component|nr:ribonuclease P protein component [Rhodospirillaceae bacterium]MBT3887604.1 ribonuclease P protein component [Rhodospirillaceae bacterium]MBT4118728.1 ribonuclease P protein component [Rhodospirillaceae bacterium]MBT4672478.1 ribonuclease P protein component [Rhodospirillaceae bacterium]MBT4751449.1 ribonuclease P protein component [Rhodospirillaceae bacterium]